MEPEADEKDVTVLTSVAQHLALSPVAFAVTEGPGHAVSYANAVFRGLLSTGKISIGTPAATGPPSASDLGPLLDRAYKDSEALHDTIVPGPADGTPMWSCTIWPVPNARDASRKLVIEVRDIQLVEGAKQRQRAVAERLLLGALREQDVAQDALDARHRAQYLASASRDLSISLDENATRDTIRRLTLPRKDTWCIVDVVESNGAIHRLAVAHPDPAKQALARQLEEQWPAKSADPITPAAVLSHWPTVVTADSGKALMRAAHGEKNLSVLRRIGFGSLLIVPFIVRSRVQGAITFVSKEGDPPFSSTEISLAVDVAARCALALDNARLYREADALRLAAELANQSKSQFLGSMSHELRTPLNAIGGFAELMELGIQGPVTDDQHVSIARIKANQQHLLTLITDILNFVRIESGRMEYRNAAVSLPQALADVIGMLDGVIAERGLKIDSSEQDMDAVAWADSDRVCQILMNLVMNAVKYAGDADGTITLTCAAAGDTVIARVADTGPGIAAEKLASIFEPFVQLTAGLAERRGGVGLGLAISRDLARAMDGDLTVESTVGSGSRFTLSLPRARMAPHDERQTGASDELDGIAGSNRSDAEMFTAPKGPGRLLS